MTAVGADALQLVQQRREHPRARAADGVAERDSAAHDVQLVFGNPKLGDICQHLGCKRFINLN